LALVGAGDFLTNLQIEARREPGLGWQVHAQAPHLRVAAELGPAEARMALDAGALPLAALRPIGDPRGIGLSAATLDGHLELRARLDSDAVGAQGRLELAGLQLTHPRLTTGAIVGARVRMAGSVVAAPKQGRIAVDQAVVRVGELAVWVSGALEDLGQAPRGQVTLRVDETPCQAVLESLPAGLAPALEGGALTGVISANGRLHFDATRLDDLELALKVHDRCVVLRDPPRADVTRLLGTVVPYRTEDEQQRPRDFPLGPRNPDWRPLAQISPHLQAAFLTAEDARFYSHSGFEPEMIRRALIENWKAGRVLRGASTISQQLVKNLYLEQARTLSRKLQETALTWRLEQVVSKRRILELYLNAIELGPGTYGVRQAARRYFGKEPGALTPLEAAHLASVAPSPRRLFAHFRDAGVDDDWMEKLYDLLGMMHRSHRLSDNDFAQAITQRLRLQLGG
jgi:hypothetical protein